MHIRTLQISDFTMMNRHRLRHSLENGRDGDVIFSPSEEKNTHSDEDLKRLAEALVQPVTTPGWTRRWIITDENEIYGELILTHRPPLKASLHRCLLMMGLERPVRSQGWGSKLMIEATTWARQQASLDWIDLFVFENNPAAKALYKKFGFEVLGTTRDMFRAFGQSIDDTTMTLKLR